MSSPIDFGNVPAGETGSTEYQLRNCGARKIKVLRVQGSCGCLSNVVENSVLSRGEQTTLTVQLRAPRRDGISGKTITIEYGDESGKQRRILTVPVTAVIEGKFKVSRQQVTLRRGQSDF